MQQIKLAITIASLWMDMILLENEFITFASSDLLLYFFKLSVLCSVFYTQNQRFKNTVVLWKKNSHTMQFTDLRCKFSGF